MVGHFQLRAKWKKSQIVALLTKIVAVLKKKFGGAFWRFLAQKGAVPDSEPLETLFVENNCRHQQVNIIFFSQTTFLMKIILFSYKNHVEHENPRHLSSQNNYFTYFTRVVVSAKYQLPRNEC